MAVLLGAKPPLIFKEYTLLTSQTWTAPATGTILVTCTGGGGQGGICISSDASNGSRKARGGGAGGFSQKTIPVKAGDTFTVVVGAGGRNADTAPNGTTDGTTGGESTFDDATAISSIALDSNGGVGGVAVVQSNTGTLAGGAGGTATGGDLNVAGGAGGAIVISNASTKDVATGGGSTSVYGLPFAGGAATIGGNAEAGVATGGAGAFGAGGAFVQNGSNDIFIGGTQGGGVTRGGETFVTADMGNAGGSGSAQSVETNYNYNGLSLNNSLGSAWPIGSNTSIDGPKSTNGSSNNGGNSAKLNQGSGSSGQQATLNGANDYCLNGSGAGAFGGGGASVCRRSTNTTNNATQKSNNGKGGVGGGGSGGITIQADVSLDWEGGGPGVVIIAYIG